jgi:Lsr2
MTATCRADVALNDQRNAACGNARQFHGVAGRSDAVPVSVCRMAKKIQTTIVDDIDGASGAKPVTFGLNGVAYRIDLAPKNEEKLHNALQEFINHAAKQRPTTAKATGKRSERDYDIVKLREWAAKKKIDLPQRGRIPAAIVERFKATLTR